jgi:SAM-dependent methyltransferase
MQEVRPMGPPVAGRPKLYLDQALRYARVIDLLHARGATQILEVGSGSSGLAAWWPGPVVGVDLHFNGDPVPNLTTVRASATELPFPDKSFDAVICTDVFEHLPTELRAPAFAEMQRVSAGLVWVAFPSGDHARRADATIHRLLRLLRRDTPGWLIDHEEYGLPSARDARSWPTEGFTRTDRFVQAWWVHVLAVSAAGIPKSGLLGRSQRVCRVLDRLPGHGYRYETLLTRHRTTAQAPE